MHRIAAALFALAVAAPGAAQPPPYEPTPYDDDRRYRYERDRYDGWQRRHDDVDRWQPLVGYANAREGNTYVRVPRSMNLSRIRIEGEHGAPVVTIVEVFYNRHVQRTRVDRRLTRGEAVEVPIDAHRHVHAVVVHTDQRYRGGYSVFGG